MNSLVDVALGGGLELLGAGGLRGERRLELRN